MPQPEPKSHERCQEEADTAMNAFMDSVRANDEPQVWEPLAAKVRHACHELYRVKFGAYPAKLPGADKAAS